MADMPHLDGAHSHGSRFDWRLLAAAAVIGAVAAGGGASGVLAGLTDLLWWVAGVMLAAAVGLGVIIFRATRGNPTRAYIKSVHGPTAHDLVLDQAAAMKREVGMIKEIRRELEMNRLRHELLGPEPYRQEATWPLLRSRSDETWVAEVLSDVPDALNPGHEA